MSLRIRGCGNPAPGFVYQQKPKHFQTITTSEADHCGDPFMSPPFGPRSFLICEECAVLHGLIW